MHQLYVLHEHASGYALFRTREFEEIGGFLPQVRNSVLDVSRFRSVVYLVAFQKFKTQKEALDNMQCVSKGELHEELQLFLENNVPKSKKSKQSVVLGVADLDLGTTITEKMGIKCKISDIVLELSRGIRTHFHKLVKGFADLPTLSKSQSALAHQYSKKKLNFNNSRTDNMIMQTFSTIDELNQDIKKLSQRVIHCYSLHFPELVKIVPEISIYIHCVETIRNRKSISDTTVHQLQDVLQDSQKIEKILNAANMSMGMDIATEDVENILMLIEQLTALMNRKNEMNEYIKGRMHQVAPTLSALFGEMDGAELIAQAGGLTNLAKLPASTVQILGARKSLFRTLKRKDTTAKFKTLNQSIFSTKTGKMSRGLISRYVANKCSLAARVDCFSVNPASTYGDKLKEIVEDQLKFKIKKCGLSEEEKKARATSRALCRKRRKDKRKLKLQSLRTEKHGTEQSMEAETLEDSPEMKKENKRRKSKQTPKRNLNEEEWIASTEERNTRSQKKRKGNL